MTQTISLLLYASKPDYYRVIECDYWKEGENTPASFARCVVYAKSEYEARQLLADYFNENNCIHGGYKRIYSVQTALEESRVFEKRLIKAVHRLSEAHPIILLEDNHHRFPFFTGDVLIQQHDIRQPEHQSPAHDWISDTLYSVLFSHKTNEEKYCYVVIDSAVYQQSGRFIVPDLIASGLTWRCLYKGEASETLEHFSPYLVDISLNGTKETSFHRRLFSLYRNQPFDLIIHSSSDFEALYHHLRKFTYLPKAVYGENEGEDETRWVYFRFYQVYALLPLFQAMDAPELASFMRHMHYCWLQDAEKPMLMHRVSITERIKNLSPGIFQLTPFMVAVFEQQQYLVLVSKIEAFITQNLLAWSVVPTYQLNDFIRIHLNQAYIMGFTLERSALYYVVARSLTSQPESEWRADVLASRQAEPMSQELFTQHLFKRVLLNHKMASTYGKK